MDVRVARTFLEVVRTGSFVRAADVLNITQTAVSARIKSLEDQLERRLFIRNKAGARLTSAGEQFHPYAISMVQVWERARHQVALPVGRANVVSIGGEHVLWNPILRDWLVWMRSECADYAVRVQIDVADRLIGQVERGSLDVAVVHGPVHRPGLVAELLLHETLVAVTTNLDGLETAKDDYVYVDWGPTFADNHQSAFPNSPSPVLSINDGPLGLEYILAVGGSGYFRTAAVQPYLESGQLKLLAAKPQFSYSVHAVYSAHADEKSLQRVKAGLRSVTSGVTR